MDSYNIQKDADDSVCPKCGRRAGVCMVWKAVQSHFYPRRRGRPLKGVLPVAVVEVVAPVVEAEAVVGVRD